MKPDDSISRKGARPRALVVGGSLAGLLAATTLRAAGWDVGVFERSSGPLKGRGGGLVLQPDVLDALRFAGIAAPADLGVPSDDRIYLDRHDRVISRTFMPQTQTSWDKLHGLMQDALAPEAIHRGERLVSFTQSSTRVTALFASGRVEEADLLIGADGALSAVRAALSPKSEPRYAGYVAWRGLVPEGALGTGAAATLASAFAFQQGRDHLLLEYRIPGEDGSVDAGRRRWNWVWFRKVPEGRDLAHLLTDRQGATHRFSLPPGDVQDGPVDELRESAALLLAPTLRDLVLATARPFIQAIVDLTVPRMVFGRALLIGDAAFVPRPHTAGGAAKAAADALALARALEGAGPAVTDRLAAWETERLAAGAAMCAWGVSMGNRIMGMA